MEAVILDKTSGYCPLLLILLCFWLCVVLLERMSSSVTLNTGASMPLVGLGTWKAAPDVAGQAVYDAIKAGYRHIDCAENYGNEMKLDAS